MKSCASRGGGSESERFSGECCAGVVPQVASLRERVHARWPDPEDCEPEVRCARRRQVGMMFSAVGPFGLGTMSKVTCWPSMSSRKPGVAMLEKWANTSAPPPSCSMKPKPLAALNHFTVPDATSYLLRGQYAGAAIYGYRVAAMMDAPSGKSGDTTRIHWLKEPAKALEVLGTTTATEADSSMP